MIKNINEIIENKKNYTFIGSGFVSNAYKIHYNNNNYLLLQGLLKDSYECYLESYKNLKFLNNNGNKLIKSVNFPSEEIDIIKPNGNFFKYGGLIYKYIDGIILKEKYFNKINTENIINKISEFLIEIYNIPLPNNINKNKIIEEYLNEFINNINIIINYLEKENYIIDKLINLKNEYNEYIIHFNDFSYIHGDFWQENIIISENYQNLIGVIDFDDFKIGDIAKDFATLLDLGYDFINKIVNKCSCIIKNKIKFLERIKIQEKLIVVEDFSYIIKNLNNDNKEKILEQIKELEELNLIEKIKN